jgi:hypothetical protein
VWWQQTWLGKCKEAEWEGALLDMQTNVQLLDALAKCPEPEIIVSTE